LYHFNANGCISINLLYLCSSGTRQNLTEANEHVFNQIRIKPLVLCYTVSKKLLQIDDIKLWTAAISDY